MAYPYVAFSLLGEKGEAGGCVLSSPLEGPYARRESSLLGRICTAIEYVNVAISNKTRAVLYELFSFGGIVFVADSVRTKVRAVRGIAQLLT